MNVLNYPDYSGIPTIQCSLVDALLHCIFHLLPWSGFLFMCPTERDLSAEAPALLFQPISPVCLDLSE